MDKTITRARNCLTKKTRILIGSMAKGTIRAAAKASNLRECSLNVANGNQQIRELGQAILIYRKITGYTILIFNELNDYCTADILAEVSSRVGMNLWLVEAHTASQPED
jgi:DNA-binding ferritin-like protein